MKYRLNEIIKLCEENNLKTHQPDENRVDVIFEDDCRLAFCNLIDEDDTLVGFDGTPWHSHGVSSFMTGTNTYIDCDELDIIVGLVSGELLIVSRYLHSKLVDREIVHKNEPFDLKYMEPSEELRIKRLA